MAEPKVDIYASGLEMKEHDYSLTGRSSSRESDLNRLGKKSVLRRDFGFFSMLGLSCTVMNTWEGILLVFAIGFGNGGYAGTFYGFLLVWLGTLASFVTMGELSSMAPTAGGQYHWTAMLAPLPFNKFLSYLIGWLTFLAWQGGVASCCFLCGTLLQGLIVMGNLNFNVQEWQIPLFFWIFLAFAVFCNTVVSRALPKVEGAILILHICGFLGILIPLVIFGPQVDADVVFHTWLNGGMWPTQGVSFLVGLLGPAFSLLGADSAVHMAEEIKSPGTNVPRAMVFSVFLNGVLALGMLIALLFCIGNPEAVLGGPTPFPFMNIFLLSIANTVGAITMAVVVFLLCLCGTISTVASASRMTWAFARDRGMPGWRSLAKVNSRTDIPINAIILTMVIAFLLSNIAFGSALAFNDVVALAVAGLYSSYFIGNTLFLYRRVMGHIKPYNFYSNEIVNVSPDRLAWGPWKVPEPLGTIINAISCAFLAVMLVFIYFPVAIQPDGAGMNWSILIVGVMSIFATVYYLLVGKKIYTGPVIDIQE